MRRREDSLNSIVLSEKHLRYVLKEYVEYFMKRRPHQGPRAQAATSRPHRGVSSDRSHPLSSSAGWADQRLLPRSCVSGRTRLVTARYTESSLRLGGRQTSFSRVAFRVPRILTIPLGLIPGKTPQYRTDEPRINSGPLRHEAAESASVPSRFFSEIVST
jgi:hypothetical protein